MFLTTSSIVTIEDPATFTDKISAVVPMTKTSGQLYEYACHEGNYGMLNTSGCEGCRRERVGLGGPLNLD